MRSLILSLLLLASACADTALVGGDRALDDQWPSAAEDEGDDGATDGDSIVENPYWSLDGWMEVVGGQVDPLRTSLLIGVYEGTTELCEAEPALTAVTPTDPTPLGLVAAWDVVLSLSTMGECTVVGPSRFVLGLGPLDQALVPAMVRAGIDPDSTSLYGLYLQAEGETVIFGVAGTDALFDGDGVAVPAPPLPDGSYRLHGLHLLPQ